MKEFQSPILVEIEDLAEGVYAASGTGGYIPPEPTATPVPADWDWQIIWCNHNTGSHSDMEVRGRNYTGKGGNHIKLSLTLVGKGNILKIGNITKATSFSHTGNTITIEYNGVFNPNESVSFGITSIEFENAQNPDNTGSYWPSGQNINCPANEFIFSAKDCG